LIPVRNDQRVALMARYSGRPAPGGNATMVAAAALAS
jgi:hypothetical protein